MALDMYQTLVLVNDENSNLIKKYSPRIMFLFMVLMVISLFTFPFIHVPVGDGLISFTYASFMVRVVELGATSQLELFALVSAPVVMILTFAIIFKGLKEDRLINSKAGFLLSLAALSLYFMLTYYTNIHNPFAIDRFILELDHNFNEESLEYVVWGAGYSAILVFFTISILFFNADFISDLLDLERYKDRRIVQDYQKKIKNEKTQFFQNSENAKRYTQTIREKSKVENYELLVGNEPVYHDDDLINKKRK